jgi:AcrR family transcriptional regulator
MLSVEKVLQESRKLILTDSIDVSSLNKILEKLQISKSSFYNLFKSRTDFYIQLVGIDDQDLQNYYNSIKKSYSSKELVLLVSEYMSLELSKFDSSMLLTLVQDDILNRPKYEFMKSLGQEKFNEILFEILQTGIEEGEIDSSRNVDEIVNLLVTIFYGVFLVWSTAPKVYNFPEEISKNLRQLTNLL